jgi:hypothetical protein
VGSPLVVACVLCLSWPLTLSQVFVLEQALLKNATDAMKESRVTEILSSVCFLLTFNPLHKSESCRVIS